MGDQKGYQNSMAERQKAPFRTSIGGQALMEGILMRGPEKQAIVVRTPENELVTKVTDIKLVKDRYPILDWPVIRGTVNLISSMVEGMKALTYSASFLPEEEQEQPSKLDQWIEKHVGGEKGEKLILGVGVFLGILLAVVLFFLLPTFLVSLLDKVLHSSVLRALLEGVARIGIFLVYMILVSKMQEIKRVWQYHGAEHKTIHCYEKGLELTVENARPQPCCHPRCGTSFLILMMLVSILVFAFVQWSNVWIRMVMRLVLLPVVVGFSYELIRLAGRHDNWLTRAISAPGRALQRLTTREPDDAMLEVAIAALREVIPAEKGKDNW